MAGYEYRPQLATLVREPPGGGEWLHEIKYDGYRIGCVIDENGGVRLISRNGRDWTRVFPGIADAARQLPTRDTIIDGEVAMLMPDGRTSFAALQQAAAGTTSHAPLVYFAFDLLRLDGRPVDRMPLEERKKLLRALIERAARKPGKRGKAPPGRIRYAVHIVGGGERLLEHAARRGSKALSRSGAIGPTSRDGATAGASRRCFSAASSSSAA